MKTTSQLNMDEYDALEAQMIERFEELIEQVILETFFGFLNRMAEHQKSQRPPVCYRSDCKDRDSIVF